MSHYFLAVWNHYFLAAWLWLLAWLALDVAVLFVLRGAVREYGVTLTAVAAGFAAITIAVLINAGMDLW